MASIKARKDRENITIGWKAQVHRKGYPAQFKTFRTRHEAERWAQLVESQMLADRTLSTALGRPPLLRYLNEVSQNEIRMAAEQLLAAYQSPEATEAGYVYIATSPSLGWAKVKIGRTGNLDRRMTDLSRHSGVPEPFRAVYTQRFADMVLAERFMHTVFAGSRISHQREFFAIPVQYAMEVLDFVHGLMG